LDGEEEEAGQEEQAYHQLAGCHHDECCLICTLLAQHRAHAWNS
jgi:hypothetical protein